jgi:hypothetical protein
LGIVYIITEDYPSPAEGNGLENRQAGKTVQEFESLILLFIYFYIIAGWSSSVARRAHNPKVVGSNPAPAIAYLKQSFSGLVVQLVRMPACHAGGRGFESRPDRFYFFGSVAQLVEQWIEAPCVGGSIPSRAITLLRV